MKKTISPATLRIALLLLNFILFAVIIWSGMYAFGFEKALYGTKTKFELVEDPDAYSIPEDKGPMHNPARAARVADLFEPPPPRIEIATEPEDTEVDETVSAVEEGPLSEKWELENLAWANTNKAAVAVLAEKQDESPASSRASRSSRYRRSRSSSSSRTKRRTSSYRRRGTREFAELQFYNDERNPSPERVGEKWYFFVGFELEPKKKIFYQEAEFLDTPLQDADKKVYVLVKEEEQEGNPLEIRGEEEEDMLKEKRKSGSSDEPSGAIKVGERLISDAATSRTSSSKATTSGSKTSGITSRRISRGKSKKPSKEDIRKLKEIRSRMPASARKKLDEGLKKANIK